MSQSMPWLGTNQKPIQTEFFRQGELAANANPLAYGCGQQNY
jgi:hypothetical protein